jgi:hypothetical protein
LAVRALVDLGVGTAAPYTQPVTLPTTSGGATPDDHLPGAVYDDGDVIVATPSARSNGMGDDLPEPLRTNLHNLSLTSGVRLGSLRDPRVTTPATRLTSPSSPGGMSEFGAPSNREAVVEAVLNRRMPAAASTARQAASSVRGLLKSAGDRDVRAHLIDVLNALEDIAADVNASRIEEADLKARSAALEAAADIELRNASGIYVFTFPHYWNHPFVPGTDRRLFKIGKVDRRAFQRIRAQARATGAPEEPLLLRVYLAGDPNATERAFHRLLDSAGHSRGPGDTSGREWFATTLEYCDQIAGMLQLKAMSVDAAA